MFVFNPYSLHAQFSRDNLGADLTLSFTNLLNIRKILQGTLGVDSEIAKKRECWPGKSLQEILRDRLMGKDLSALLLGWLDKNGPFLYRDVSQSHSPNRYMAIRCKEGEVVVTDTLVGEAAFLTLEGKKASLVSLSPSDFEHSLVEVNVDELDESIFLENILQAEELQTESESIKSWTELFSLLEASSAPDNFPEVFELSTEFKGVERYPLNPGVIRFLMERLRELCALWRNGNRASDSLVNRHFVDESESNKNLFREKLIFQRQDKTRVFCPYHAKFSYFQYRLHISWPIKPGERVLLAYLGPKITKK